MWTVIAVVILLNVLFVALNYYRDKYGKPWAEFIGGPFDGEEIQINRGDSYVQMYKPQTHRSYTYIKDGNRLILCDMTQEEKDPGIDEIIEKI